jgi:DNA-binding NtrC family response regulator
VVCNEPNLNRSFSRILAYAGYTVSSSTNLDETLKRMGKEYFALIVLDISEPDITAEDFFAQRPDLLAPAFTLFLIKSAPSARQANQMQLVGQNYLVEPFLPGSFLACVAQILEGRLPSGCEGSSDNVEEFKQIQKNPNIQKLKDL